MYRIHVVQKVNQSLTSAISNGLSDIHFEPYEDVFRVRYRIDGVLKDIEHLPGTNNVNQVSYVYGSNRQGANQITNYSSYVYDANGSVLSSAKLNKTLLMDYDLRSNLVSSIAVNNQYIIDYDYDASGERVYSGMGSSSKIYINSITSNPLSIIDSNDNVTHYIYGPKGIVAKRNESLTYYLLKDHLGSTRVVMNENNQAISSYDYDAWGNPMNSTVSEMSAYRYTGREYDEETGLHNFRARLYDSTLMRFYQVDPAEQFASPYVYSGDNPIGLVDPDGKVVYQAIRPVYYFGVITPFKHQFLINIPDNPSDFARFGQRTNIYGKIGFTVGATKSDDGHLAMKYNEQTDLLYARRYLQNVSSSLKEKVIKPIGHKGTDTEFIITIVHKSNNYAMNTEDKPIEYPSTIEQLSKPNSNSWIQSLLRSIIGSKFQTDMDPKGDIGCEREIDPELFEEPKE